VDPNGDQYECSDTPLTPDYTPETVTCNDWPQDKLYSGDWSLVVISNNGNADPIAFQRDFALSVGTPTTQTITPTVTATDLETAISSIITTKTSVVTTTLLPKTTTKRVLVAFGKPTLLSKPLNVQVITKDLFTITKTRYAPQITQTTVMATPSCVAPTPNWIADPLAKIEITILKTIFQKVASAKFKRGVAEDEKVKREFVVERAARLQGALQKRAPDASVVTVTATNTNEFVTETSTQWTTITTTIPTTILSTAYVLLPFPASSPSSTQNMTKKNHSTSTPPIVTVTRALLDFAALQTLVAQIAQPTITHWDVKRETTTKSVPWTVTITKTSAGGAWVAECTGGGGRVA
jgi:hypothetical protein